MAVTTSSSSSSWGAFVSASRPELELLPHTLTSLPPSCFSTFLLGWHWWPCNERIQKFIVMTSWIINNIILKFHNLGHIRLLISYGINLLQLNKVPTYCDIITSNMTSTIHVVTNCQKRMKVHRNFTSQIFNNLNGKLSQKTANQTHRLTV